MQQCPYCDEMIQDGALKCRYCKEWLAQKPMDPGANSSNLALKETSNENSNIKWDDLRNKLAPVPMEEWPFLTRAMEKYFSVEKLKKFKENSTNAGVEYSLYLAAALHDFSHEALAALLSIYGIED